MGLSDASATPALTRQSPAYHNLSCDNTISTIGQYP